MRIYLPRLKTNPSIDLHVDGLEMLAQHDRYGVHELVTDPEQADVVLYMQCHLVDWRLRAIREHAVARTHWEKVMVYDERDDPWLSFPGIYVSAPSSSFDHRRQRAWSYPHVAPEPLAAEIEPDLLFSFVGSRTARCREALFQLRHPSGLVEEVHNFMFWDTSSAGFTERRLRYREVLARSRFVLCPRGRGTSTFRLYETLAAGRVPVIISDEWVPPPGPEWDTFSVRVSEQETGRLVEMLTELDAEWRSLATAARDGYEQFFSEEVAFHRMADLLLELRADAPRSSRPAMRVRAGYGSLRRSLSRSPLQRTP